MTKVRKVAIVCVLALGLCTRAFCLTAIDPANASSPGGQLAIVQQPINQVAASKAATTALCLALCTAAVQGQTDMNAGQFVVEDADFFARLYGDVSNKFDPDYLFLRDDTIPEQRAAATLNFEGRFNIFRSQLVTLDVTNILRGVIEDAALV